MKKLQNNFTTPEQSKRLLDIGLPVKSADCYYCIINATIQQGIEVICDSDTFFDINTYLKDFFPCWSVGRLMEIMALCYKFDFPNNGAIQVYATDIKKGIIAFFKLIL